MGPGRGDDRRPVEPGQPGPALPASTTHVPRQGPQPGQAAAPRSRQRPRGCPPGPAPRPRQPRSALLASTTRVHGSPATTAGPGPHRASPLAVYPPLCSPLTRMWAQLRAIDQEPPRSCGARRQIGLVVSDFIDRHPRRAADPRRTRRPACRNCRVVAPSWPNCRGISAGRRSARHSSCGALRGPNLAALSPHSRFARGLPRRGGAPRRGPSSYRRIGQWSAYRPDSGRSAAGARGAARGGRRRSSGCRWPRGS